MKLRTMAVIALALVAGGAQAQDAGWDSKMGAVFGIGVDGNPLDSYNGKVGLQYNLGPQAAIRLGVDLRRLACGDTETTATVGGVKVVSTAVCGGTAERGGLAAAGVATRSGMDANSVLGLDLSAEYLIRSSTAAVSPYFGAGAYISFESASLKGEDSNDVPNSTTYEYADKSTLFGLGLLGKAGVEWRINKVIALFAEYQLDINLIQSVKMVGDETDGGNAALDAETKRTDIFNLTTGVSNGGLIGITAFF